MREVEINWGDNRKFVEHLSASGGRFFVIGGVATHFHVPARIPDDLDIIVEPSADMLAKLEAALRYVGAPPLAEDLTPERFSRPPAVWLKCQGGIWPTYMDVFTPTEGVNFSEHWATAEEAIMSSSKSLVRVASNATMQALLRLGIEREREQQPAKAEKYARDLALLVDAAR